MGDTSTKLTWQWPLIAYEWVPNILQCLDHLIEPTWEGLKREMRANVVNEAFSNRITEQLKVFLTQTGLVLNSGRIIKTVVKPEYNHVKAHLIPLLVPPNYGYSRLYAYISANKLKLDYENLKQTILDQWPKIADYSIFRQWNRLYQYVGYGIVHDKQFIPSTAISRHMVNDFKFMQTSFKSIGDPRLLTGCDSLHSECDFLAWTKGEDLLPITSDKKIIPRIPREEILSEWDRQVSQLDAWHTALLSGRNKWTASINGLMSSKCEIDLETFIFTIKNMLDVFLFNQLTPNDDYIGKDKIHSIKTRWEKTKHFVISKQFWISLPSLYKDVTRLYWGAFYYRNSLKRPIKGTIDTTIFENTSLDLTSIHIRCFRSKRTLQNIYQIMSYLYTTLERMARIDANQLYQSKVNEIKKQLNTYLPTNAIDRHELLGLADAYCSLDDNDKACLMEPNKIFDFLSPPNHPILQICFWVNIYHALIRNPKVKAIANLDAQLHVSERNFLKEIAYYENDDGRWDNVCQELKSIVEQNKKL